MRAVGLWLVQKLGIRLIDTQTGECLGRVLIVPWRGKIHVIGLARSVRVSWLPQNRVTYWKQEIGFAAYPAPDFPNERNKARNTPVKRETSRQES
jgi:hypothetical protein